MDQELQAQSTPDPQKELELLIRRRFTTPQLTRFLVALLVFFPAAMLWSSFVGESREAHIFQCETSPDFRISVDAPNAPWGSLEGAVELSDGLREQLADGSLTIEGRFRNGEFHGPDGLVVSQLSAVIGDCPLN